MKIKNLFFFLLAISLIVLFSAGCNKTATTESDQKIDTLSSRTNSDAGMTEMENQFYFMATNNFNSSSDFDRVDFSKANTYFKKALQENPNNLDANLGAALTEVFGVYADAEINDAIKQWESYKPSGSVTASAFKSFYIPRGTADMRVPVSALGANFVKIIQMAKTDPPTISKMQSLLKTKFLPRIDYAMARLAVIEQHPAYEMKISGKMQGNITLTPVYMDLTEVYLLDAMLNGMKAVVSQFLVFQFELSAYTTKAVVEAVNQNNTTFFVLASDGKAQAANVKSGILTAIAKIRSAVNFLKNETDVQSDDIIKLKQGNNQGIASSDLDTVLTYLTRAEDGLKNGVTIDAKDADSDGNNYSITVNLSNFFDNPPANPKKDWLPPYTVDTSAFGDIQWHWTQQTYATFTFPDPTFGGVFPNMTNDMLKRLMYIDEEFAWRVYLYVNNYDHTSISTMTARLQVGATSYANKPYRYEYPGWFGGKEFRFFVNDQTTGTGRVFVTLNGVEKELTLSAPATVNPKHETNINANVTPAPQNLTVKLDSGYVGYPINNNVKYLKLSFALPSGYYFYSSQYRIDKDSTGTGFKPYISTYLTNEYESGTNYLAYYDVNFVSAKTYKYRIEPIYDSYTYGITGYIPNNYSNTATITTP